MDIQQAFKIGVQINFTSTVATYQNIIEPQCFVN